LYNIELSLSNDHPSTAATILALKTGRYTSITRNDFLIIDFCSVFYAWFKAWPWRPEGLKLISQITRSCTRLSYKEVYVEIEKPKDRKPTQTKFDKMFDKHIAKFSAKVQLTMNEFCYNTNLGKFVISS